MGLVCKILGTCDVKSNQISGLVAAVNDFRDRGKELRNWMYDGRFSRRLLWSALALSCFFSATILAADSKDTGEQGLLQPLGEGRLVIPHPPLSENAEEPPVSEISSSRTLLETELEELGRNLEDSLAGHLAISLEQLRMSIPKEKAEGKEKKKTPDPRSTVADDSSSEREDGCADSILKIDVSELDPGSLPPLDVSKIDNMLDLLREVNLGDNPGSGGKSGSASDESGSDGESGSASDGSSSDGESGLASGSSGSSEEDGHTALFDPDLIRGVPSQWSGLGANDSSSHENGGSTDDSGSNEESGSASGSSGSNRGSGSADGSNSD